MSVERFYSPDRPAPKTVEEVRRWDQQEFDKLALAFDRVSQRLAALEARILDLETP